MIEGREVRGAGGVLASRGTITHSAGSFKKDALGRWRSAMSARDKTMRWERTDFIGKPGIGHFGTNGKKTTSSRSLSRTTSHGRTERGCA